MFKLHRPLLLEYCVYKIFEEHISKLYPLTTKHRKYEIKIIEFYGIKTHDLDYRSNGFLFLLESIYKIFVRLDFEKHSIYLD